VTVKVFPVSSGTVQLTGSGERIKICSGDLTLVGSGGDFTTGSQSIISGASVPVAVFTSVSLISAFGGSEGRGLLMQAGFVEDFLSFTVADLDWRFGERFSVVSVIGPTDCDRTAKVKPQLCANFLSALTYSSSDLFSVLSDYDASATTISAANFSSGCSSGNLSSRRPFSE
jgi:hypothetical protein